MAHGPAKSDPLRGLSPGQADPFGNPRGAGYTDSNHPLRPCPRCGTAERVVGHHPCTRCVLEDRLRAFLADDSGSIRPQLTVLHRTLVNTDRPHTVLTWFSRSSAAAVLGDLGSGARPLTHDALDDLGPSKQVEHLRSVLVATGALPERDEYLARSNAGSPIPSTTSPIRKTGSCCATMQPGISCGDYAHALVGGP